VSVSASDNVGVTKVDFYKDDTLFATDTTSPYEFSWDTIAVANGYHTMVAKAYDSAGNVGTSSTITVTVSNIVDSILPVVTILSPTNGATVSGTVTISASATDNVKVTFMEVYIDGIQKTSSTASSITTTWSTKLKKVTPGLHTITVKAYDASGNIGSSSSSVTVVK
jgi:hypothetical protein